MSMMSSSLIEMFILPNMSCLILTKRYVVIKKSLAMQLGYSKWGHYYDSIQTKARVRTYNRILVLKYFDSSYSPTLICPRDSARHI